MITLRDILVGTGALVLGSGIAYLLTRGDSGVSKEPRRGVFVAESRADTPRLSRIGDYMHKMGASPREVYAGMVFLDGVDGAFDGRIDLENATTSLGVPVLGKAKTAAGDNLLAEEALKFAKQGKGPSFSIGDYKVK